MQPPKDTEHTPDETAEPDSGAPPSGPAKDVVLLDSIPVGSGQVVDVYVPRVRSIPPDDLMAPEELLDEPSPPEPDEPELPQPDIEATTQQDAGAASSSWGTLAADLVRWLRRLVGLGRSKD